MYSKGSSSEFSEGSYLSLRSRALWASLLLWILAVLSVPSLARVLFYLLLPLLPDVPLFADPDNVSAGSRYISVPFLLLIVSGYFLALPLLVSLAGAAVASWLWFRHFRRSSSVTASLAGGCFTPASVKHLGVGRLVLAWILGFPGLLILVSFSLYSVLLLIVSGYFLALPLLVSLAGAAVASWLWFRHFRRSSSITASLAGGCFTPASVKHLGVGRLVLAWILGFPGPLILVSFSLYSVLFMAGIYVPGLDLLDHVNLKLTRPGYYLTLTFLFLSHALLLFTLPATAGLIRKVTSVLGIPRSQARLRPGS